MHFNTKGAPLHLPATATRRVLAWPMTLASRVSAFNWPLDSLELLYIVDLVKKLFVTGYGARGGACRQPAAHVLGCSYVDEDGKLEYNWRKIAKRTLKTLNFWCVHRPWCRSALMYLQVTAVLFVPLFVVAGGRSRGSCSMAPR